jgi:hypothetical protein
MIKNGHPLRSLDISYNDVDVKGFGLIVKSLSSQYCNLQVLRLSGLNLSLDQVKELSKHLVNQTSLLTLSIAENDLSTSSVLQLAHCLENTYPLQSQEDDKETPVNNLETSKSDKKNVLALTAASTAPLQVKKVGEGTAGTNQILSLDLRYNSVDVYFIFFLYTLQCYLFM